MYTLTETERIALVAENTYNPVVIADQDKKIVWVNHAFTELTGYSLAEVVGKTPSILHCEKTDKGVIQDVVARLNRKERVCADVINRNKFGREYWIRFCINPVTVDDRFIGYISIENEVTTEINLLNDLRDSELKYKAIFNSTADRHIFIDKNHILKAFNKSAQSSLETYTHKEIKEGIHIQQLLTNKQLETFFYTVFNDVMSGGVYNEEIRFEIAGQMRWFEITGIPVIDDAGQIMGCAFNWHENTKEKHLQVLLDDSTFKYKAIVDSTEDRHVLVDSKYRVLAFNKSAQTNLQEFLKIQITEQDNFLSYFTFDNPFEMEKGIQSALQNRPYTVVCHATYGAAAKWLRIVYLPVTGSTGKIIGASVNWSDITAQKEAEQKVLDQLQQLKEFSYITSHKLRQPLANIIGITQLIDIAANPKDIAPLISQLKDMAAGLDSIINAMSKTVATANYVEPPVDTAIKKDEQPKHIFIVDDDPVNNMITRKLFERTLGKALVVEEFVEAKEALGKLAAGNTPDLIILDINMYPLDGWGFLKEFEKLGKHVPIIMCSSSVDPEDLRRAKENPMVNKFLSKPLSKDHIGELYNLS